MAKFDHFCDDFGLDTIEIGSAMGVTTGAGKMEFGNVASVEALFKEVEEGTDFGNTLGNGVVATCKALGIDRIPAFKGQAIPAHDPRVTKLTGTTYATSPMGADHTAGIAYSQEADSAAYVKASKNSQLMNAMLDSLGLCSFAMPAGDRSRELIAAMLSARYGKEYSVADLDALGSETIKDELAFNKGTEFGSTQGFPEWVRTEASMPSGGVFDVTEEDLSKIWDDLD